MSLTKEQKKTYAAQFKLTSTGEYSDVGTADIKRKMLAVYVDVSTSSQTPVWELLGYKQTSVQIAANYDTSDITDVNGETYTDINSKAEKIDMSEYNVNPSFSKFLEEAIKLKTIDCEEDMQGYKVLIVYGFMRDTNDKCMALYHEGCTLILDNDGGEGLTKYDVSFTLSGKKTFGTVPEIQRTGVTFTEYTPAASE